MVWVLWGPPIRAEHRACTSPFGFLGYAFDRGSMVLNLGLGARVQGSGVCLCSQVVLSSVPDSSSSPETVRGRKSIFFVERPHRGFQAFPVLLAF